jgi:thiol-disulfide isomerase/thioredoxin
LIREAHVMTDRTCRRLLHCTPARGVPVGAAAAALLAMALLTSARGAAQSIPADSVLRDFRPFGDYVLWVNGKEESKAEIFQSERAAAILIMSSAFPSPVLLNPRAGSVETVSVMKVAKNVDGSVDLLADATLAPQGQLQVTDDQVAFTANGRQGVLKPKPPLLGLRRVEEVTAHNPEYLIGARNYRPNPRAVAALKKESRPITVRIYYGSWCPHCRQMVPHAVKVEQQLRGSKIHFEYFGLPPRFGNDPEAKKMAVQSVPTGVVYVNGKESGRILSTAWETPEQILVSILAGNAPAASR